jgi:hypothetical protein
MGCTVRELLARVDSHELTEWMAFHNLDPWGEYRADLRAGIVASTVANVNTVRGRKFKPSDFMVDYLKRPEPEPKTVEELKDMAVRITAMFGGKV